MKNVQKIAIKRGKVFVSLKIPEKLSGKRLDLYKRLPKNTWDFCEYLSLEDLEDLLQNPPKGPIDGTIREEDLKYIFEDLLRFSRCNMSDEEDIIWFLENYPDIEIRENIISSHRVRSLIFKYRPSLKIENITDLLRFGIYMIGGNPDLPHIEKTVMVTSAYGETEEIDNPEYKSFHSISRDSRRDVLSRIESWGDKLFSQSVLSEIKEYHPAWRIFVNRYHPRDFKSQFPHVYKLSTIILKKKFDSVETWSSTLNNIQRACGKGIEYAKFMSSRPKEFLKNLKDLLRSDLDVFVKTDIVDLIWNLRGVDNVSLFECMNDFDRLSADVFMKNKTVIDPEILQMVRDALGVKLRNNIRETVAGDRFKNKKVFIPEILRKMPIEKTVYSPRPTIRVDGIEKSTAFEITGSDNIIIDGVMGELHPHQILGKHFYGNFINTSKELDKIFIRSKGGGELSFIIKEKNFTVPSTSFACLYVNFKDNFAEVIECIPDEDLYYISGRTLYSYDILREYAEACGGIITPDPEKAEIKLSDLKFILGIC